LGTVERGDQRGRLLGFPTANVNPHNEALPPNGVYGIAVRLGASTYRGVLNIGTRPTFDTSGNRIIEAHLLDFAGDIYGRELEIIFRRKLRDERPFANAADLQAQIAADVLAARSM
jgi:riboflavin kinase/FMN adenylyltransferase